MQSWAEKSKRWTLSGFLDHFIPAELLADPASHRRARMFMISHVFGPFLGNSLPAYLYIMDICRDYRVFVFFFSILAFWAYPFALRWTKLYSTLAVISVQNLIFCGLWACYAFGGLSSPFLPWILIFPLLAFLYLPQDGWLRNVLLLQIFGSAGGFIALMLSGHQTPYIDLKTMQTIGMISMGSVAVYFAMMALYFARMFNEQRAFTKELRSLDSISDNVQNLTLSAQQASAAKANFVASMSHELRTPLNAIIGYSHLLMEEAADEQDDELLQDLRNVHESGSNLLRLIDDILDYSRIEAGKMPLNPTYGSIATHVGEWRTPIEKALAASQCAVDFKLPATGELAGKTDWKIMGQALQHICAATAGRRSGGRIELEISKHASREFAFAVVDFDEDGGIREPQAILDSFEHEDDDSASKYGGTGIEMVLAQKFVQLLGGRIETSPSGARPANLLIIPAICSDDVKLAEAA